MSKALFVIFIGEDGADYGGLTRHFFPAVYEKVSIISQNNQEELEKREYEIFGKIISLALSSVEQDADFLIVLCVVYLLALKNQMSNQTLKTFQNLNCRKNWKECTYDMHIKSA